MRIQALRRSTKLEVLDSPADFRSDLPENLRDIRRLNRWIFGTRRLSTEIDALTSRERQYSLLDVATGSGDIPLTLAERAGRRDVEVRAVGVDLSQAVIDEAIRFTHGRIQLLTADARQLPFGDNAFDIVISSLAAHHFDSSECEQMLREMWRVAKRGVVIVDVRRSRWGYAVTRAFTTLATRNRMTRHDAPLSILRAYTTSELHAMAEKAGMQQIGVKKTLFLRQVLSARKHHDATT